MRRIFSLVSGLSLAALLFVGNPQQAQAITVTAVECSVIVFPCPLANILASGTQTDGINVLGAGGFDFLNFAFANARVTFTGTITASNVGGVFASINGQGVGTEAAGVGFDFLDIDIHQNYFVNPAIVGGIGLASEYNIGTCNAAASAAGSYVQATLVADGTVLPIMGGIGDCATGVFNFVGAGFVGITQPVQFDALAQFGFAPSGAFQAIDLPYGESDAPEPASFMMMGGGMLALVGIVSRRKKA